MMENGLRNVMEVIQRQKWEKLFKRRELVHVDAVKEFYAKLTMSHNRKKDVAKSKVRGVEIVFDHLQLAFILGIPGNNGIFEGESESGEKFYDAEDEVQGSPEVNYEVPAVVTQASAQQKETGSLGVDPSCPTGRISEAVMNKLQAEFERARANKFQADLKKAHAENARLLALLQQAQTKPKP
ncbi:hypothetical protein Dimus_013427 [Dionaea muscipula]